MHCKHTFSQISLQWFSLYPERTEIMKPPQWRSHSEMLSRTTADQIQWLSSPKVVFYDIGTRCCMLCGSCLALAVSRNYSQSPSWDLEIKCGVQTSLECFTYRKFTLHITNIVQTKQKQKLNVSIKKCSKIQE